MSELYARLQRTFVLLDDDALSALANRGLVRRARKDLESRAPTLVGERNESLKLEVEGCTVLLSERPSEARCSCPAKGICRHILSAIMFVAAAALPLPDPPADPDGELSAFEEEAIRKWAGRALFDRAERELSGGLSVAFRRTRVLVARISELNVECSFVPGSGLEGMLCDCHAPRVCLHRVVAVLAWQIEHGVTEPPTLATHALLASSEAPRTRDEVRASVIAVTEELVAHGLSTLNPAMIGRLRTLATSAHGVDLPALERFVRALADEGQTWLDRAARASDEAILSRAATVHALAQALGGNSPALVGVHRSRYEPVRNLELTGIGARAWRSASGYVGVTVYFWDAKSAHYNTWTEARPIGTPGFDPVARFSGPGPWSGCQSPAVASASRMRLPSAWRSRSGRLSARAGTSAVSMGPTKLATLPLAVRTWSDLVPIAEKALVVGFRDRDETASLVLIEPARWGPAVFDGTRQELVRPVFDDAGRAIPLVVRQSPETDRAIAALESYPPGAGARVFGVLEILRGSFALEPIAILEVTGATSLGLSHALPMRASEALPPSAEDPNSEELELETDDVPVTGEDNQVHRVLSSIWNELESAASAGLRAYRGWPALTELSARSKALGLTHCANGLERMKRTGPTLATQAGALLDSAWIVHLCVVASAVQRASAKLT
ncbi:MAG TPA: SWIM zinc finger family protein [Polyangiaceae bacterium]